MKDMFVVVGSGEIFRAKNAEDAILMAEDRKSLALFIHKNPVENNFSYNVLHDARVDIKHLRESFCPTSIMYLLRNGEDTGCCRPTFRMMLRENLEESFLIEITEAPDGSESFISAIGVVGEGSDTYTISFYGDKEDLPNFPTAWWIARECAAFNNTAVRLVGDDDTFITVFNE